MNKKLSLSRMIRVSSVANIFEWYEFVVFAYLSTAIGKHFFDTTDPISAAFATFSIFALSYLARPIGSVVFGYLADKKSPGWAIKVSMMIMAVPAILIAFMPGYAEVGVLSSVLLVTARLVQGFGAGGELPTTAVYAYNHSESRFKKFMASVVPASSIAGILLASSTITVLNIFFTQDEINAAAWRYPFYLAIPITLFIWWIRKDMLTSNNSDPQTKKPYFSSILEHKTEILKGAAVVASLQVSFYTLFVWMPKYLELYLDVEKSEAMALNTAGLFMVFLVVVGVGLSLIKLDVEKLLRRTILVSVISVPTVFAVIQHYQSTEVLAVALLVLALSVGAICGAVFPYLNSLFKDQVRGLAVNVTFTFPTVFIGSFSPIFAMYLIEKTGDLMMPAYMVIAIYIAALTVIFEVWQKPLRRPQSLHQSY